MKQNFPIWVLVELISFGDLLHICRFYEKENNCTLIANNKFMNTVRDFRNAAAHSNCLMNKMTERMEETKQPIMGPLSRPRSKILRVAVSRIILSSEASKVKLVGNLVA